MKLSVISFVRLSTMGLVMLLTGSNNNYGATMFGVMAETCECTPTSTQFCQLTDKSPLGGPCDAHNECLTDECDLNNHICSCKVQSDCPEGEFCSDNKYGICYEKRVGGDQCNKNHKCKSELCLNDGVCACEVGVNCKSNGDTCSDDWECTSSSCNNGICGSTGATCDDDNDCMSGICMMSSGVCACKNGVDCLPVGATCSGDFECSNGDCNTSGRCACKSQSDCPNQYCDLEGSDNCRPKKGSGASCSKHYECSDNSCRAPHIFTSNKYC